MGFNMNVKLFKIDEEQKLVYGRATQEVLDKSGEIMDYESSKPMFEKWSNDFATRTNGKSYGNVRVQHDSKRVGGKIAEPLAFNDTDKAIDVCVKVTDDTLFSQIKDGVYTGFSIGGSYGEQWTDDAGITHYTAIPSELSIVDNPCVSTATIMYVKADGTIENLMIGGKKPMDKDEFLKALSDGDLKKAFSFAEISAKVRNAIYEKKRGSYEYFWVDDIYPDSAVIRMEDTADCYRIPYAISESGEVTLGEAEKVVCEWKPVGEAKAEKAIESNDLQKNEGDSMNTEVKAEETVEKAETAEAVEKATEAEEVKQEEKPVEKAESVEKTSVEIDSKQEEKDKEEVEKSADVFEMCSKAMDNADDSVKEKCGKLFHKMVEKGLYCSCDKCTKAVEGEKAEKATADTDLNKAASVGEKLATVSISTDELAKAMGVIDELKKAFDGLKSDNDELRKQVEKLENEPVVGGAMVATGTMALDKTIGGSVGNPPTNNSEEAMLRKMIDNADSPILKEAYSKQLAQLEMKKVFG